MPIADSHPDRAHDQQWYGCGSPVGLGLPVLSLALSIAAVLAALSLVD
jgi:hypothetical protein